MNRVQLLEHFDRISDAPDAMARLRCFILDLAVRGKLVGQDPNDEPAEELLKRITAITGRQANIGRGQEDQQPFFRPSGWAWSRVGLITTKTGSGSTPRGGQSVYQSTGVPFLRSQNVYNDGLRMNDVAYIDQGTHTKMRGTSVEPGDLLLNITGGSIGRCCLIPDDPIEANISQHIAIIRPAEAGMRGFMHKIVLSPFFQSFVIDEQTGAGRGGLPKNRMDQIPVPVPPLAEQHRIVAKVGELMTLCDQLEAARDEREARRGRLVAASLHRIGTAPAAAYEAATEAQSATSLRDAARFHLDHLPRLTTRPEHIKQLRQTILSLAVRGRLVPQDPNEEPATELLKRVADQKKSNRGNAPKISTLSNEGLPAGWVAVDLTEYALDVCTGPFGSALHQSDYTVGGIPLVNPSHMINDRIAPDERVSVPADVAGRLGSYRLEAGDIVMARRGEVGRAALVEPHQGGWLCGTGSFYLRFAPEINRYFFLLMLRSSRIRSYLVGKAVGTTMVNLNHNILKKARLEIPPLAEQHRIVAKVDELMALCEQLEAQLITTQTDSRRLLEAVLREALTPGLSKAA
jgi:type I restriction enzyme S subunit